jgi:hypothetical protein
VIDELNNAIVRNGSLTIVNRQQLDLARQELNFQMSGDVSDESAKSTGKFLGAQSVLTGSFTVIGRTAYRFRVKVIDTETGVEQYSNSIDIKKDPILTALTPAPPKEPIKVLPVLAPVCLVGFNDSFDWQIGGQAGINIKNFLLLADFSGGASGPYSGGKAGGVFHAGGIMEIKLARFMLGVGGGIGFFNHFKSLYDSDGFFPYIRSLASIVIEESFPFSSAGLYYDYHFDYGYKIGAIMAFRFIL